MTGAVGLAGVFLVSLSSASCSQPDLFCDVASGPYMVQYIPKDSANDCLMLSGERVGMKTYNPPTADKKTFDASKTTVALQANSVGVLADDARAIGVEDSEPNHTQYSLGDYSNKPDANDFCSAPALSMAEQHIPETAYTDEDGNAQVFPETRISYQWSNLEVYTTFAAPGTAATGEVTITKEVTDPMTGMTNACTVTYIANALYPRVGCEGADAEGNPSGMPDETKCCPVADLANGRTFGSGINPDFKVKCDPVLLSCVLDWKPGEAFPPMGSNPACGN